jgi:hypothetical protein
MINTVLDVTQDRGPCRDLQAVVEIRVRTVRGKADLKSMLKPKSRTPRMLRLKSNIAYDSNHLTQIEQVMKGIFVSKVSQ